GEKKTPYIIHRTSLGCYERTLAYLLETYAGALPTWLAPEQVRVLSIKDSVVDYAQGVVDKLGAMGIRVESDFSSNTLGYKIRNGQKEKVPYMVIIGEKDMENNTISIRYRNGEDLGAMSFEEFASLVKGVIDSKEKK
ncbi:MAG: threonine--tRNA ligase, partial [Thermoguttaceae bacterium]|nr:threonine--tRNA ligase [Thermoguttaceae bacterium]